MSNSPYNNTYLCKDDFEQLIMSGALVGYNMCIPPVPFDIQTIFNLRHSINEAGYVSLKFRYLTDTEGRTETLGVVNDQTMSSLILQNLKTKDAGSIPVLFGASTIFPLLQNVILDYAKPFIEETGELVVVDNGHEELVITDLANYKFPTSIARQIKKGSGLKLVRISKTQDLYDMYAKYPTAELSDIHTQLYFGGIIDSTTTDDGLQNLERMYRLCHNHHDYVSSLADIYTTETGEGTEYQLYAIMYNDGLLGHVQAQFRDGEFYWVNTSRLRLPSIQNSFGFNINNVIISALISHAQSQGAHTFNLGMCVNYPYKHAFTDKKIWVKGIRYA